MKRSLTKAQRRARVRRRTQALRRAIGAMDFVASGTLHSRTKSCGKSGCKCRDDVAARHGPYLEWTRRRSGRQTLTVLTPRQAALLESAVANRREIERLLAKWDLVTEEEILRIERKSL